MNKSLITAIAAIFAFTVCNAQDNEPTDAQTQYKIGLRYENGDGVIKNNKVAFSWFEKAAKQGHAGAQYRVGLRYDFDDDYENAAIWYRKAAEQGYVIGSLSAQQMLDDILEFVPTEAQAQYDLATRYDGTATFFYEGRRLKINFQNATCWYRKAADQGHVDAQCRLGDLYTSGVYHMFKSPEESENLHKEAVKWYRMAIEKKSCGSTIWSRKVLSKWYGCAKR